MGKRFKYYRRQSFDGTRSRAGHPQTNEYCNQLVECRLNSKPLVPPGCAISPEKRVEKENIVKLFSKRSEAFLWPFQLNKILSQF